MTHSVRLPDDVSRRLTALASAAKRSKSSLIVEAIEGFLAEREDLEVALARFRDPGTEWVDHAEVGRDLDVDP